MLKTYDELLDIAESKGLHVYENQPLKNLRGFIYRDAILLREGLSDFDMRAVLSEEIMHFDRDFGDVTKMWRMEIRTHRRVIESNIGLYEFIDAIIDNGEYANSYTISNTLQIPEWLYSEIYEYYSELPFRDITYRGHIITFNPIHVWRQNDVA